MAQTTRKMLFHMFERDELFIDAERERLRLRNPDVKVTQHDALRSLISRGSTTTAQVEQREKPVVNTAAEAA